MSGERLTSIAEALAMGRRTGYARGVKEERARVRKELLEVLEEKKWPDTLPPGHEETGQRMKWAVYVDAVFAALDHICPEEPTT